ncbi:hypothetical protein FXO37_12332 [Capsicum annuum]|nr:hypothetical protein FXO37_12332 [Capsicum annuum]
MPWGDGPFQVLQRINDNAYKIDLPPEYQVHNTFNVCDLSREETVKDGNDSNLRTNSLQDGEDDTGIPSSRLFTRSQAHELQRFKALFTFLAMCEALLESRKEMHLLYQKDMDLTSLIPWPIQEVEKEIRKTNFEAFFPSNAHFEESSITVSADASCGTRVEETGACMMGNGAAAASRLVFTFGVLDLSLGPFHEESTRGRRFGRSQPKCSYCNRLHAHVAQSNTKGPQDRSTGQTIDTGHESQGLCHLTSSNSFTAYSVTNPPDLIYKRLGHPSLSKLQNMVSSLSSLSTLDFELYLGESGRVEVEEDSVDFGEPVWIYARALYDGGNSPGAETGGTIQGKEEGPAYGVYRLGEGIR